MTTRIMTLEICLPGLGMALLLGLSLGQMTTHGAAFLTPELVKVMASDGQAGDAFGFRAALSEDGTVMAVGAYLEDERGTDAGAVYLFTREEGDTDWTELKKIFPASLQAYNLFGRWVDLEGDTLAASGGAGYGVFIFQRDHGGTNNWGEVTNRTTGLSGSDSYGTVVTLDGERLAVSAPTDDEVASDAGACFLYERHAGGSNHWGQVAKIVAYDGKTGDDFGNSMDLEGDTLVVAAQGSDSYGVDAGSVYIYERNGEGPYGWGFIRAIGPTDSPAGDGFGRRVRLSGDILVVGSPFDDGRGTDSGAFYIYKRNQGGPNNWGLVRKVYCSEPAANENFARQVLVSGDYIVAATFGRAGAVGDPSGRLPGKVFLFHRNASGPDQWGEVAKILPEDSPTDLTAFGCCGLDLRNNLLMVGRGRDNERGTEAGAVHVFEVIDTETIQLSIDRLDSQARLSWPEFLGLSLMLEQTPTLSPPDWQPFQNGMTNPITVPMSSPAQYFRLQNVQQP